MMIVAQQPGLGALPDNIEQPTVFWTIWDRQAALTDWPNVRSRLRQLEYDVSYLQTSTWNHSGLPDGLSAQQQELLARLPELQGNEQAALAQYVDGGSATDQPEAFFMAYRNLARGGAWADTVRDAALENMRSAGISTDDRPNAGGLASNVSPGMIALAIGIGLLIFRKRRSA